MLLRAVRHWSLGIIAALFVGVPVVAQIADAQKVGAAKSKLVTTVPSIDSAIHDAMQSRSYEAAIKLIEDVISNSDVAEPDYLRYLQGVARTHAKQYDEALATFLQLETDFPESTWLSRSRFGRAHVFVMRRQYIDASAIYQAEAERLLSRGRKDDLAKIYLEFADRYYEGMPATDPSQSKLPNYTQALTYYTEAAKLGPTPGLRQTIDFRIARCNEETPDLAVAVAAYEKFLKDYSGDTPRSGVNAPASLITEAWYRLGGTHLKLERFATARNTWQDFIQTWSGKQDDEHQQAINDFIAKAEYRLAHTYGLPEPKSVGDLELAVTASEKFLAKHPDHEMAPQAELEIAQGYARYGRHSQAATRLISLIENPKYVQAKQISVAREMLGQEYLAQEQFDDAISAWKLFLEKHPTDPKWPAVQKQIVDTEYAKANDAFAQDNFDQARELWQTFLNKYPLDPRAANVLYQFGEMKAKAANESHQTRVNAAIERGQSPDTISYTKSETTLFEQAIVDWQRVVSKYPDSPDAARAAFSIANLYETRLLKMKEALEWFEKVSEPLKSQAMVRVRMLTTPELKLVTERRFHTDEQPRVKLSTRNLEKVAVKTYRVDMTDYFRKMHLTTGIESLDIALIDPDKQFDYTVKDYGDYRPIDSLIELPIEGPGVTAVTVSSDKLESTTMVVISDIEIIVKASRNEVFLFAEDMREGKPANGVSVLVSDGANVFAEEVTSADGVLQKSYDALKTCKDLRVFAVHEGHMASTVSNLQGLQFATGLTARGYLYTDRPAYRSGQLVNIKALVRWVDNDRFVFNPDEKFTLDVYDARGRRLKTEDVRLNAFGSIRSHLLLPDSAIQGDYRIHLHRQSAGESDKIGALSFDTTFKVTEYKLEPVELVFDVEKSIYFRGEKVNITIALRYYHGTPLADEEIEYRVGDDGELVKATTDSDGKVAMEFETARFSESQTVVVRARSPQRGVEASQFVYIATRGFTVTASSPRSVYVNGESFETTFKVTDPAGNPLSTTLKVEVVKKTKTTKGFGEKVVQTHKVSTQANNGEARQTVVLGEPGSYIIRAIGKDQFDNDVSNDWNFTISGDQDTTRLRILADRHSYSVGETADVNLHWRDEPALALVTFEGAKVLSHQLVSLVTGDNRLQIPMHADFAPNVFLSVAVMQRNKFHTAQSEFTVSQDLRIAIKPSEKQLKPGDDLVVDIEVTDPQGNPVATELSLALVQASLLNQYTDVQKPIPTFFGTGRRSTAVRQETSCTFDYQPKTTEVSSALVEFRDQRQRLGRERVELEVMGRGADGFAMTDDFNIPTDPTDLSIQDLFGATNEAPAPPSPIRSGQMMFGAAVAGDVIVPGAQALQSNGLQSRVRDTELKFVPELGLMVIRGAKRDVDRVKAVIEQIESEAFHDRRVRANETLSVNALLGNGQFLAYSGNGRELAQQLSDQPGVQLLPTVTNSETGFWDPTIVTDPAGKAKATIPMPTKSTSWKLRAKGIDKGVLAGEAFEDIVTRKDLFGEMKLPLAFTVGDQATVPIEIHNSLDGNRTLKVTLKTTQGDKSVEQSQTIEVTGPRISRTTFDVDIEESDEAELELTLRDADTVADQSVEVVSVRPYGFPVFSTASGTSSQSTLAMIELEEKLNAVGASLEISIGSTVNRSLVESVVGGENLAFLRCGLPVSSPLERSVSDVLGGVAVLTMTGSSRDADTPEAQSLTSRIMSAVTHLVSSQNEQGAFVIASLDTNTVPDALLSARVMWALSQARTAGFAVPEDVFENGKSFLKTAFSTSSQNDLETQTILLHAMAVCGGGDFAFANRLHRERNRLNSSGLAHLALTLASMNRKEMAKELVDLIEIPEDGSVRPYGQNAVQLPWMRDHVELKAIILLALQEVATDHPRITSLAKSLLASRVGSRFAVEKANGPAIAALARWQSKSQATSEKYKLQVSINDNDLETFEIDPAKDSGQTILVPSEMLRSDKANRVEFKLDGRATFSYSVVMTGFVPAGKIASTTNDWSVSRSYQPAKLVVDGQTINRGWSVVSGNYSSFTNALTQLPVGDLGEVTLMPRRLRMTSDRDQKFDYLVLTEPIPAGCIVLDGSVTGAFERFEIEPGQITFYIGDIRNVGDIRYSLLGYVPGKYRVPQSILRSFYDPSLYAVSAAATLEVLAADDASTDEYRLSPDELFALGKVEFEKGNFETAHKHLTKLFTEFQLQTNAYEQTVRWLFDSSLALASHGDTVAYFEILKEKFPEVEISFEDILRVAMSYRELGEYERGYLVYRSTVEGSFERESQVAGFLNARGEFVRSARAMERLLRDYPAESYVATATYALAQETYRRAPEAKNDAQLKAAGITRVQLIRSAIEMLDHFVTTWPEDPADDQASFALATALLDLEQYQAAIARCEQYATRYPKSRLLDAYWYMIGYSHFELEQPQEALAMCRKVAEATFPIPETGGTRVAENRWEAIYIMGQIYHSLGQAASAIDEYAKVSERFTDASEAIKFFSRKEIAMDEVTTIRSDAAKKVELRFRNISDVALKVYRIDLMKFGLMQRNLNRITAINLAGIKPYHEETIKLGDGKDYRDRTESMELPLKDEGAYLIVCRGENLYASGLVLVSPLELTVEEDATSGRVRVSVKDASNDSFASDVHVNVIGSANANFVSGTTDLRGLMIADDIQGTSTVIAMRDSNRYAFYRGSIALQNRNTQSSAADPFGSVTGGELFGNAPAQMQSNVPAKPGRADLRSNLFNQNGIFQMEQKSNYEDLLNNSRSGVKSKEAY